MPAQEREKTMTHGVAGELYGYWNALRAGRPAPERNDVDPAAIRTILADTFVLEFNPADGFPFRICGSRINALFQCELRGVSFLRLWRETDRREIESILKRVADRTQPCLLGGEPRFPGTSPLHIEVALLPLSHCGSTHSRLLGCADAGDGGDWLGLIGAGAATLTSVKPLAPEAPRRGGRSAPLALFARKAQRASPSGSLLP